MLSAGLHIKKAIKAVLTAQTWDKSVKENLTPTEEDWNTLKEMAVFFNIFRRPTVQSQADEYPTLHNTIPNYLHILRQLNVWQAQDKQPILKLAAKAAYKVIEEYYKEAISSRYSFVAIICDPRYKLKALEFLFNASSGIESTSYKRAKIHFQHTFSQYQKRAIGLAELERQRLENEAIDALGSRSPTPEVKGEEPWRVDPLHGWDDYIATLPVQPIVTNDEVSRWLKEPVIPRDSTPEAQRLYMLSKAWDFPVISQMARDYHAIPATSAPSERVFSIAGNLISKKRTRISSENVRYVLCLRNWGVLDPDNDEDEIIISEDGGKIV
jgi:hypothetical protein